MAHANKKKGAETREAVLDAARRVFSRQPYNAASIRMIAGEGGFGHALIGYYFPTKAALFDEVARTACDDLCQGNELWLDEVSVLPLAESFSRYVELLVQFSRKKPWVLRIMMLNLAGESMEDVPGKERLMQVFQDMRQAVAKTMGMPPSAPEMCRFSDSFNALALYYLGAPDSAAWLLQQDPGSTAYFTWVHQTLTDLFLPTLKRLWEKK